jgi:hypothetical protein
MRIPALLLAAPLAALALPAFAFEPTGEVTFRTRGGMGQGAAFDAQRIAGPGIDLARVEGGAWSGMIEGGHAQLWPTKDGVAGDAVVSDLPSGKITLHIERSKDGTSIRGLYFSAMVHLEITEKTVSGRIGNCSVDLTRRAPGIFDGDVGCTLRNQTFPAVSKGSLMLARGAASADAPMPQLALSLLAVLPR